MKARVRPSAYCTRRRIRSPSVSISCACASLRAGCMSGRSKTALTWPCASPWRTSEPSPRPPSASAKPSSRIDLPAPVSPVRTLRPSRKPRSSRSIRTISRMESCASIGAQLGLRSRQGRPGSVMQAPSETAEPENAADRAREALEGAADIGATILARLQTAALQQLVGVLVPRAIREVVAEHGRGSLGFVGDAHRHIGLGQAHQRLLDMPRRLVLDDDLAEAVHRAGVVALLQIVAADVHLLAGELVARHQELLLGVQHVFRLRIICDQLLEGLDRLSRPLLITGRV